MKIIKIILSILISIIILIVIDITCIFTINKPLFAIKVNTGDSVNIAYKGLLYDTYNCIEYSKPQIKNKFSKFSCSESIKHNLEIKEIVDMIAEVDGIMCAQELELFYEDKDYKYYFSCIKSDYVNVYYTNDTYETVESALKKGNIKIKDLDRFGISYIKEEK